MFEGREGVHCVARHPEEWAEWLPQISGMMRHRYDQDAEYHRGNVEKPEFPRYLVVIDEVQEIRTVLGKNDLDPFLQQLSRQMRASEGRLLLATQRPDTEDAIPGPVRDMLEDRIVLGYVSPHGARMAFGEDWRSVVDEYGADTVPGRGMARIGGRLIRLQGIRLHLPREHPEVEMFYPPKAGAPTAPPAAAATPTRTTQWAPKPPPTPQTRTRTSRTRTFRPPATPRRRPHRIRRRRLHPHRTTTERRTLAAAALSRKDTQPQFPAPPATRQVSSDWTCPMTGHTVVG
ncbi:hypothetical protein GCM10029964_093130 [Kibdelosporangium lantanae]